MAETFADFAPQRLNLNSLFNYVGSNLDPRLQIGLGFGVFKDTDALQTLDDEPDGTVGRLEKPMNGNGRAHGVRILWHRFFERGIFAGN